MFTFQSLSRSLDLQLDNKKVVTFRNYTYSTQDAHLASLIRAKVGTTIWEVGAILDQVQLDKPESEEYIPPKPRRGRPPKSLTVQGMRTTAAIEDKGEST